MAGAEDKLLHVRIDGHGLRRGGVGQVVEETRDLHPA